MLGSILPICLFITLSCSLKQQNSVGTEKFNEIHHTNNNSLTILGNQRTEQYIPLLKNKNVAVVANQTSLINKVHIVDSLLSHKVQLKKVFAPEHGFRGTSDNGAHISNSIDPKTNLPIISLYGKNKKPKNEQLNGLDVIIFDIQDVGARFYTYLSTLHYVMEAAAENNIHVIVLDRPNPNAHYIDGPVMQENCKSFVGLHPVPIVYGMTIGEYALMINGEKWLKNGISCDLTVVDCENYWHSSEYILPIAPSPNLQSKEAIALYPSLCLFEGTVISVGRGTQTPFEIIGHPLYSENNFSFTPKPTKGSSNPPFKNKKCYGIDIKSNTNFPVSEINLKYLINGYKSLKNKTTYFNKNLFFDKLSGNKKLREQIINGKSEEEIKKSWEVDLNNFKKTRSKYLLYDE